MKGYRVLLTRRLDRLPINIPVDEMFDQAEHVLLAAGARVLVENVDHALSSSRSRSMLLKYWAVSGSEK